CFCFDKSSTISLAYCFFFQAEDGIRDFHVTGVQTCALPILVRFILDLEGRTSADRGGAANAAPELLEAIAVCRVDGAVITDLWRSEERRVGKECRTWWVRDD